MNQNSLNNKNAGSTGAALQYQPANDYIVCMCVDHNISSMSLDAQNNSMYKDDI